MSNKKSAWTTEERGKLKKYYKIVSMDEMLERLPGRSLSSIYAQVSYLRKRGWTFGV